MNEPIPIPSKPNWSGPYVGGVTQSNLIKHMECPFRAYIFFILGLKDPAPPHENLPWGSIMHKGLEHYIQGDSLHNSMQAMYDYYTSDYNTMPEEVIYTCFEMLKLYPRDKFSNIPNIVTEQKLNTTYLLPNPGSSPREIRVRGMADVVSPMTFLCDHKCKGRIYPQETAIELGDDLQMNFYSHILRTPQWQYDLIQCPLVAYGCPDRKPGQSAEAFAHHIFHTYNNYKWMWPIKSFVPSWICCIPYYKTLDDIDQYWQRTITPLINRFCDWWDYVTQPDFDPNNPECYNSIFFKSPSRVFDPAKTDKFKGNYHDLINGQMELSDLLPINSYYAELE